jgi:predicted lysophospholipase L1 biosynthesis ABC-type transport system permease subunit
MYMPFAQAYWSSLQLVVRSELPPETLVKSVQSALRSAEPNLPTGEFQALDALVEGAVSPRRFILLLLGVFAMTALLLASLGIYGVLSYAVSQQAREIGIRMALGASARLVQWRIVKKTLTLTGLGIFLGWLGSLMMTRGIASLLYGVEPADPATFALTVLVLLIISGLAAYLRRGAPPGSSRCRCYAWTKVRRISCYS